MFTDSESSPVEHMWNVKVGRLMSAPSAPRYVQSVVPLWLRVIRHVDITKFHDCGEEQRLHFPPAYLLWEMPQKSTALYLQVLQLRREMVDRFRRQEPGLTIAEWREVLGDEYWNAYTTLLPVEDDAGRCLHQGTVRTWWRVVFWFSQYTHQVRHPHCQHYHGLWVCTHSCDGQ
jgi:hypothetical protein